MKNYLLFISILLLNAISLSAQKYFAKAGKINFNATANNSPEIIEAVNRSVVCVLDTKTGLLQFSVLMKGFELERALMQEHFNENYIESDKFPKSDFKGMITDNEKVYYTKDGSYAVAVKGKLTIHGATKEIETTGKLIVQNGKINATADFVVTVADFKIKIPGIVADKISKIVTIKVSCLLEPLPK
ncbi:MAG: YceI family protein [Chitinophagaceae bacterium]|nr:MAG: YceI family protein [Chitinophagaceae bacterium]